jgi:hypothetical protein
LKAIVKKGREKAPAINLREKEISFLAHKKGVALERLGGESRGYPL